MRHLPIKQRCAIGFTLVEVMLVMLLIGLLATTVVMSFSGESNEEQLEKEAERFQQIFQFVAETAMLKQQEWGLYVQSERYGFIYYNNQDAKWLEADQPVSVQQYILPHDIRLQLELEGLPGEDGNLLSQLDWQLDDDTKPDEKSKIPVLPQVFILSSGEISPFKLILKKTANLTTLYSSVSTDFAIPLTRTAVSTEQP